MIRSRADNDARYRSLLQKAVRRGHMDLVYTTSALLESLGSRDKDWYRTRAAIITFEECWPFGCELSFNRKFHSKVAALIKVTRVQKIRDASGLGHLAYALHKGDASVFDGSPEDKHIRIVANAIQRPDDFWQWISTHKASEQQAALIANAMRFKHEGWPRDKAVIQAAAYLAVTTDSDKPTPAPPVDDTFPYWVVFDRHSPEGKLALRDVARDLHIQLPQLARKSFHIFETTAIEQEIALVAQRLDVTEELDRLASHVVEIEATLAKDEAIGRRLDFIIQELNREANTFASKVQNEELTRHGVELKVLIEQMREQVQNLE